MKAWYDLSKFGESPCKAGSWIKIWQFHHMANCEQCIIASRQIKFLNLPNLYHTKSFTIINGELHGHKFLSKTLERCKGFSTETFQFIMI